MQQPTDWVESDENQTPTPRNGFFVRGRGLSFANSHISNRTSAMSFGGVIYNKYFNKQRNRQSEDHLARIRNAAEAEDLAEGGETTFPVVSKIKL